MHLSYATLKDEERRDHWEYAIEHDLIGLDHRGVGKSWLSLRENMKGQISPAWRRNFDLFYGMKRGDLVVVAAGTTDLLGIGRVEGSCTFRSDLGGVFFQHVRRVRWKLLYKWEQRFPMSLPGFQNTILRVDEKSRFWPITGVGLRVQKRIDLSLLANARDENEVLLKVKTLSGNDTDQLIKELDRRLSRPGKISGVVTKIRRNQSLPILLKAKHHFRCQICGFTFKKKKETEDFMQKSPISSP